MSNNRRVIQNKYIYILPLQRSISSECTKVTSAPEMMEKLISAGNDPEVAIRRLTLGIDVCRQAGRVEVA